MKILIVAGTKLELYFLSSVVYLLKSRDQTLKFRLFLPYNLENNITPEIKSFYSEIEFFGMPALLPKRSKNPIKMFRNIFDNFYQYLKFRRQIKKQMVDADIVCIAGIKEFFANILCRLAPKNIRLVALRMANQKMEETADYKKRPVISFFLNIKNFLLGYSIMEYKWSNNSKKVILTSNFVKYPYNRTISIADYNIGKEGSNFRLPPPFIALRKMYKLDDANPAILVAGERMPPYDGWGGEDQEKYEKLFNYLKNNFDNYKLYFKPKRKETGVGKYNLEGFEILLADNSLEEICLRRNIKKIISIKSISSKVAAYLGISGYWLYPMFKMPEESKKFIESLHCDMQSVIRVNEFEDLKKEAELFIEKYDFDTLSSFYWKAIIL